MNAEPRRCATCINSAPFRRKLKTGRRQSLFYRTRPLRVPHPPDTISVCRNPFTASITSSEPRSGLKTLRTTSRVKRRFSPSTLQLSTGRFFRVHGFAYERTEISNVFPSTRTHPNTAVYPRVAQPRTGKICPNEFASDPRRFRVCVCVFVRRRTARSPAKTCATSSIICTRAWPRC